MLPAKVIFQSYCELRERLEQIAAKQDFDIRYFENGAFYLGEHYMLLRNPSTGAVKLVAAHDADDLAGAEGADGLTYPLFHDKLREVKAYDAMPAPRQIRADILNDGPQWSDFMIHCGNLIEIPLRDSGIMHFRNDFASYVAEPVKPRRGDKAGRKAYDVYAYFDLYGHRTENMKDPKFIDRWATQLHNIKFKGIYLGRIEDNEKAARKFIHDDFAHRFLPFLEGKNPLSLDDIKKSPGRSLSMFASNKISSFELRNLVDIDWWLDVAHDIWLADPRDYIFKVAHAAYKVYRNLRHHHGKNRKKIAEFMLPHSHAGYEQHRLSVEENETWHIMNATQAQIAPFGATVYKDFNDNSLALEKMLTAIHSETPCLVRDAGQGMLSLQMPDGSKLYYAPNGKAYVTYLPDGRLSPLPGHAVDMVDVSEKLRDFYQAGKVVCLHLKQPVGVPVDPAKAPASHGIAYEIERTFIEESRAYTEIATLTGGDAGKLMDEDRPGVPTFVAARALRRQMVVEAFRMVA